MEQALLGLITALVGVSNAFTLYLVRNIKMHQNSHNGAFPNLVPLLQKMDKQLETLSNEGTYAGRVMATSIEDIKKVVYELKGRASTSGKA